jgi:transcription elongation GreA/GreB family factor
MESIMKRERSSYLVCALCAAVLLFAGCESPLNSREGGYQGGAGTGLVRVRIGTTPPYSRTLAPSEDGFKRFDLSFESAAGAHEVEVISGGSADIELEAGTWTITARAYSDANGAVLAAGGSAEAEISPDAATDVSITLAPVTGSGKGTFALALSPSINIKTSLGLDYFAFTLSPINGGAAVVTRTGNELSGRASYQIDAGIYLLSLDASKDGKHAGLTDVVHIYSGLTTSFTYVLSTEDFQEVLPLTQGLWTEGFMPDQSPYTTYNANFQPVGPLATYYYCFFVEAGKRYAVNVQLEVDKGRVEPLIEKLSIIPSYQSRTGVILSIGNLGANIINSPGLYSRTYTVTSDTDRTVVLSVSQTDKNPGKYLIAYGKAEPLEAGVPAPGAIEAGGVRYYEFSGTGNSWYQVALQDKANSADTGEVRVSGFYGDIATSMITSNVDFKDKTSADTPLVRGNSYRMWILRVDGTGAGTYSIGYGAASVDSVVNVTGFENVPAAGTEGVPIDLSAVTVLPPNATNKSITWTALLPKYSMYENTWTYSINGNSFTPTRFGDYVLTATAGTYTKTFPLAVAYNPRLSDASLASLTSDTGTWAPAFAPSTLAYTLTVGANVSAVILTGAAAEPDAVLSGDTGSQTLGPEGGELALVVTARHGETSRYKVTVIREGAAPPERVSYNSLALMAAELAAKEQNTAANPYKVALGSGVSIADFTTNDGGLANLFDALSNRYVDLDLSGIANNVTKWSSPLSGSGSELLVKLTLPSWLVQIGDSGLKDCPNLVWVKWHGSSATTGVTVGNMAFYGCSKLEKVELPLGMSGDNSIGNNAFTGCYALRTIILNAEADPTEVKIANNMPFGHKQHQQASSIKVYVQDEHWEAYKAQPDGGVYNPTLKGQGILWSNILKLSALVGTGMHPDNW